MSKHAIDVEIASRFGRPPKIPDELARDIQHSGAEARMSGGWGLLSDLKPGHVGAIIVLGIALLASAALVLPLEAWLMLGLFGPFLIGFMLMANAANASHGHRIENGVAYYEPNNRIAGARPAGTGRRVEEMSTRAFDALVEGWGLARHQHVSAVESPGLHRYTLRHGSTLDVEMLAGRIALTARISHIPIDAANDRARFSNRKRPPGQPMLLADDPLSVRIPDDEPEGSTWLTRPMRDTLRYLTDLGAVLEANELSLASFPLTGRRANDILRALDAVLVLDELVAELQAMDAVERAVHMLRSEARYEDRVAWLKDWGASGHPTARELLKAWGESGRGISRTVAAELSDDATRDALLLTILADESAESTTLSRALAMAFEAELTTAPQWFLEHAGADERRLPVPPTMTLRVPNKDTLELLVSATVTDQNAAPAAAWALALGAGEFEALYTWLELAADSDRAEDAEALRRYLRGTDGAVADALRVAIASIDENVKRSANQHLGALATVTEAPDASLAIVEEESVSATVPLEVRAEQPMERR